MMQERTERTGKMVTATYDDLVPTLERCREIIRSGGVILYPTDTFYGLGADPKLPAAVARLFSIKGRPAGQPILLLLSDAREVSEWAAGVPQCAERLMAAFWPGPLTIVFRARSEVLSALTGGTDTIGLRVPGSELARNILAVTGALTGTSANRSGGQSADTVGDIPSDVRDQVDLIIDGGRTPGRVPSTVVDVSSGVPRIIREGSVTALAVMAAAEGTVRKGTLS